MGGVLGRAILQLSTDDTGLNKGLEGAHRKAAELSQSFLKAGAVVTGIGAAFVYAAKKSIDTADEFAKQSRRMDVSVETLSAMAHAAELSGTSLGSLERVYRQLSDQAVKAAEGNDKSSAAFAKLGIEVRDVEGKIKPVNDLFLEAADGLAKMEDGTEKTALMMELFGSRAGTELATLLAEGGDGIRAMMADAEALGLVISTETAVASENFNDSLTRLTGSLTGVVYALVDTGLLDRLADFANWAANGIAELRENNPQLLAMGAALGAAAAVIGPLLLALGALLPAIKVVVAIVSGPVGIIVAITALVAILAYWLSQQEWVQEFLAEIWEEVGEMFGDVMADIRELFEVVSAALKKIWEDWGKEITIVFRALWAIIEGVFRVAWNLISGVVGGAIDVISGIVKAWVGFLTGDWSLFASGLEKIWTGLWNAIVAIVKAPIESVKNLVSGMTGGVTELFSSLYAKLVGKSIVPDMIDGIVNQFGRLEPEIVPVLNDFAFKVHDPFTRMANLVTLEAARMRGAMSEEFKTINNELAPAFATGMLHMKTAATDMATGVSTQVSKIVNDFAKGVVDILFKWEGMWESLKNITIELGKAVLRAIVESLIEPVIAKITKMFTGLVAKIIGKSADTTSGVVGGMVGAGAGAAAGAAGAELLGGMALGPWGIAIIAGASIIGGLLAGRTTSTDKKTEENTRFCAIALIGPLGVIETQHESNRILWRIRDSLYELLGAGEGGLGERLWDIYHRLGDIRSDLTAWAEGATAAMTDAPRAAFAGSIRFDIRAIDTSDMERAVRTRIYPELERMIGDRRTIFR